MDNPTPVTPIKAVWRDGGTPVILVAKFINETGRIIYVTENGGYVRADEFVIPCDPSEVLNEKE